MGKETTLVALYLCALVSVVLSVVSSYKEEDEGWSTSAVFTSRNLLDTDDDDDQPPVATPQPKKVLSSTDTPSVEEIKKLSDSRLRKKLFLLGLPYKDLTVPELRESLTKALYPELAAKQLLEKLEKQKQLEAAEAARQLATKLAEEARKKKEQEEKEEAQRLAEQRLLDEERQREQFALEEEHHLKKEAFLAKQAARKEQERRKQLEAQKKQEIAEGDIKWVDWNRFGQRPQYPGVLPNGQEEDWSKKELSDSQKRRIWELKTNILPDVIRVLKGDLESWGSPPFHFFPWNRYVPVDPLIAGQGTKSDKRVKELLGTDDWQIDADGRFMAYQPRGGLNYQRQSLLEAIAIARLLRRTLILPPFGDNGRGLPDKPLGWYYNITRLMDFIPSMEWSQFHEEFLSEAEQAALKKKAHAEARFGDKNNGTHDITQESEYKVVKAVKIKLIQKGKPPLPDNFFFLQHNIRMWREREIVVDGMLNEVDVVAKFGSGRAHEQELLVFDGLLNDFLIAPELLDLLLHVVVYPWPLRARANDFIQTKILDRIPQPKPMGEPPKKKFFDEPEAKDNRPKEDTRESRYFAVHLRIGPEWVQHCYERPNITDEERERCLPAKDVVARIKNIRRLGDFSKLFLSIDAHEDTSENPVLQQLESLPWVVRFTTQEQKNALPRKYDALHIGILDTLICAQAELFIGNMFSLFTQAVNNERHLMGKDPLTSLFF